MYNGSFELILCMLLLKILDRYIFIIFRGNAICFGKYCLARTQLRAVNYQCRRRM